MYRSAIWCLIYLTLCVSSPMLANRDHANVNILQAPLSSQGTTQFLKSHKSPALAVILSALIPGAGHGYLGDWSTAGGIFGIGVAGAALYGVQRNRLCSEYRDKYGGDCTRIATGIEMERFKEVYRKDPYRWLGPLGVAIINNDWFYGMYAAYRDARINNNDFGYQHPMPTETLSELAAAPFSVDVLKKPEVWGGFLTALGLAFGIQYFLYPRNEGSSPENPGFGFPLMAIPVGIGEETFFRGYVQPAVSEWATPLGGLVISSLLFGAAHIPNAQALGENNRWRYYAFSLPFITAAGAYFGWIAQKNTSLKETVAIHTWYDFVLFAMSSISGFSVPGHTQFNINIPF